MANKMGLPRKVCGGGLRELKQMAEKYVPRAREEFSLNKMQNDNAVHLHNGAISTEEEKEANKKDITNKNASHKDTAVELYGDAVVDEERLSSAKDQKDAMKKVFDTEERIKPHADGITAEIQNLQIEIDEEARTESAAQSIHTPSNKTNLPLDRNKTKLPLDRNELGLELVTDLADEQQPSTSTDTAEISSKKISEVLQKSVHCMEFVPRAKVYVDEPEFDPYAQNLSQGDDSFILDLLKDTIHILTYSPGDFDGLIDSFAETLSMFITKRETMEELVSIFVNKAITEPNFVYSAVRMAHIFQERKTLEISKELSFRACLYPRLQHVFKSIPHLLEDKSNTVNLTRATSVAMLFADLLCNMKMNDKLNPAFLRATFGIIDHLLNQPCDASMSCLIKVLKLTGPTLDEHKIKQEIPQVDEIFNRVRDLSLNHCWLEELERGQYFREQLFRVYKLHTRNWDREDFKEEAARSSPENIEASISETDWTEYYFGEDEDPENPSEMDSAFEAFLKESGQI